MPRSHHTPWPTEGHGKIFSIFLKQVPFAARIYLMKNRNIVFTAILFGFALLCAATTPTASAVVPAPDGGYPGFNTAEGQKALFSLTTGAGNTAIGSFSLFSNTDGSFNTGVGTGTLLFNVGDQSTGDGVNNTAIGAAALLFNTTGNQNAAVGTQALFSNTEGAANTATGYQALASNTTGSDNTATGDSALFRNTTGGSNTAIGQFALVNSTTGNFNTAVGADALESNNEGMNNTAIGADTLLDNETGSGNTTVGFGALAENTTGNFNTAVGDSALSANTTGGGNTVLGYQAGIGIHTADNVIAIRASGEDVSNSCYIGEIFGATSPGGTAVFINGVGKLGTLTSSRRFKDDIKPMDKASEALLSLKPVTFRYKKEIDPAGTSQFGLVAEEVEKVNPDLVVRDNEGKTYSVRYEAVNAMLLNEFLKEHKKIEEQEATITELKCDFQMVSARQQKEIQTLSAQLKEQASQIQTVSAQLKVSKPAPRMAVNP
jgi:Chaperone of endosialidase